MLVLENVLKQYQTKAGEVNALNGVSLTFPSSGLVFIVGKSGSGKTTLLNVIGGLDGIDGGEIYVQDKRFSAFSAKEYDSYRNTFIGFIFQEYNLLSEHTVEYNIKLAMELQGAKATEEEFDALLKEVEIDDLKYRKPSELSGGQRQRVAIARALVKHPRIIMADEPTGALDSATGAQVLETLKKLSKDKLVIVVSHDEEFAEKYADRIIRLVDGQVVEDVTFADKELNSNVTEQEETLVVKQGADLTEKEKDELAAAVKNRKKISFTEKLFFREKKTTGEVAVGMEETVALKKSKMKLRSSAYLGVKSLWVKPVRLIITILISALAFAVFGLFDTIANVSTAKVLQNQVKKASSSIVAYGNYVQDYEGGDMYGIKLSQETVDTLEDKTGGAVKGIFDFSTNTSGASLPTIAIEELRASRVVFGRKYYTNAVNGFVEFSYDEFNANGAFKDFDYEILIGDYPRLRYETDVLMRDSLYQVGISTYLADSIMHYLNGETLGEKEINNYADLLGATITVDGMPLTICALIDCGAIPEKYEELKGAGSSEQKLLSLRNDYDAFINADAKKCLFVADGFRKEAMKEKSKTDAYYIGNNRLKLRINDAELSKNCTNYVYNAKECGEDNVLLFNGQTSSTWKLADDEILIHHRNLEDLFTDKIYLLNDFDEREVTNIIRGMEDGTKKENLSAFKRMNNRLDMTDEDWSAYTTARLEQTSTETGELIIKDVKIVGVYFGVDNGVTTGKNTYKMMMNENLMRALNIYEQQGGYSQVLFSEKSVRRGAGTLANYLTSEEGLSLIWYKNTVLNDIKSNETMIHQVANLFLYAALALAVFSIFMLYNYISTSIANKRRSIGVLRGLGAGSKDILRIFLTESLIIGLINSVLACGLSALGCMLVNLYIYNVMHISIAFALFGLRQILIISGVAMLTAVLASALPIFKIAKKKPVQLIRKAS